MYDEHLLSVAGDQAAVVAELGLPQLGLKEREHLQEWVLMYPQLLGPGVDIVTSEYDKWQTAKGEAVLDRLDILGLGPDGRLVVAELKRDVAPHTIHMQAINYAAMVSRLSPQDVAELWAQHRSTPQQPLSPDSVLSELQTKWLLTPDSIKAPRIVLLASDFPASVTASVVWLNERGVDIDLVRFRPYQLPDGKVVVSFTRLYPIRSVEEFTVGRRVVKQKPEVSGPSAPWDLIAFQRLAEQGNETTLAMLDLCAAAEAQGVSVLDIAEHAGITVGQVRGQLAGLTMRLRNPRYGYPQSEWPVTIDWSPSGVASYRMPEEYASMWRKVRQQEPDQAASHSPTDQSGQAL